MSISPRSRPHATAEDCERYYVAIHEAGHAVMSFQLGVPVEEVDVVPTEERLGVCRNAGWPDWCDLEDDASGPRDEETELRHRLLLEKHVQVTLAGPEAERRARGAYNREGADGDESIVRLLARRAIGGTAEETAAFTEWLRIRTARRLARREVWHAVEAVARALLERSRLRGSEVDALHGQALADAALLGRQRQ